MRFNPWLRVCTQVHVEHVKSIGPLSTVASFQLAQYDADIVFERVPTGITRTKHLGGMMRTFFVLF
jgi:hypothetical protein